MKTKYDETNDVLQNLNEQFLDDGVQDYEWDYKNNFTDKEIQELSKTHKITYDIVQQSNEDKTLTDVVIYKERKDKE